MSTKRDLVEAHSFSRRRLVTAFVSGAPGGREVEPVRPGRTVVGGLALAILLVAGAAIAGIFLKRPESDWLSPGLIIAKETGTPYVILDDDGDPELRPLDNNTSAKLIFGDALDPRTVADEDIAAQDIGEDIGIFDAPKALAGSGQLINTGWTACTDSDQAIRLRLAKDPGAEISAGQSLTVQEGGKFYLLVDGDDDATYKFELPDNDDAEADNLLEAVGASGTADALEVTQEWLNLFPAGPPLTLESFDLEDDGIDYAESIDGLDGEPEVGDVVEAPTATYLLTSAGPVLLTEFAEAAYLAVSGEEPREASAMNEARVGANYPRDIWPEGDAPPTEGDPCARLEPEAGEPPTVRLAANPSADASAEDIDDGDMQVSVQPGRGAFVLVGGFDDTSGGLPYVVDAAGKRHQLLGPKAPENLGYEVSKAPIVPDTWMRLFECGVQLSTALALAPPDPELEPSCE
ncbi:type VII secretion protein EccB [Nocardioides speluncae]|uniref:type VII secretion protein EccB n=1 Tax=Nocardioides speluncae TaxID=2670337 RepID=UPI000D69EDC1|nr:type VII secretion protein EccB [Nocardioides speluncae]